MKNYASKILKFGRVLKNMGKKRSKKGKKKTKAQRVVYASGGRHPPLEMVLAPEELPWYRLPGRTTYFGSCRFLPSGETECCVVHFFGATNVLSYDDVTKSFEAAGLNRDGRNLSEGRFEHPWLVTGALSTRDC